MEAVSRLLKMKLKFQFDIDVLTLSQISAILYY
jgi:hypothetical protein